MFKQTLLLLSFIRKYGSTLSIGIGQVRNGLVVLKVRVELCNNHSRVRQNICRKMPLLLYWKNVQEFCYPIQKPNVAFVGFKCMPSSIYTNKVLGLLRLQDHEKQIHGLTTIQCYLIYTVEYALWTHYSLFAFTWSQVAAYAPVHHCYDKPNICRLWNAPTNGSCYMRLFNTQLWKLYFHPNSSSCQCITSVPRLLRESVTHHLRT